MNSIVPNWKLVQSMTGSGGGECRYIDVDLRVWHVTWTNSDRPNAKQYYEWGLFDERATFKSEDDLIAYLDSMRTSDSAYSEVVRLRALCKRKGIDPNDPETLDGD